MEFKFQRKRPDAIPEARMLAELEKAAGHFNYNEFGRRDFNKIAEISSGPIGRHYGSWKIALAALKKHLQMKGLDLHPRKFSKLRYSDKEMFDEMERIWNKVSQRPSRADWEMAEPKISYGAYGRHFGGWTNACLKFIEYKMGRVIITSSDASVHEKEAGNASKSDGSKPENNRTVPLGMRLKVLDRDNFRCHFCGRSPATDVGVRLHIDHIVPFSKGGRTIPENLQTLCYDCNLGKSDKNVNEGTR